MSKCVSSWGINFVSGINILFEGFHRDWLTLYPSVAWCLSLRAWVTQVRFQILLRCKFYFSIVLLQSLCSKPMGGAALFRFLNYSNYLRGVCYYYFRACWNHTFFFPCFPFSLLYVSLEGAPALEDTTWILGVGSNWNTLWNTLRISNWII